MSKQRCACPLLPVYIKPKHEKERSTMGTALIVIVYLTNGVSGANMSVTQFYAPPTQVFSSNQACQAAQAAVLAQAIANMKITAICMNL
jgi:hypothetical protein